MKKLNAVVLSGQGDLEIYLVNDEYFNWIDNQDALPPEKVVEIYSKHYSSSYDTKDEIMDRLQGGPNSWWNDRALQLGILSDIPSFSSLKEFCEYTIKNDIQIKEEFNGYIY